MRGELRGEEKKKRKKSGEMRYAEIQGLTLLFLDLFDHDDKSFLQISTTSSSGNQSMKLPLMLLAVPIDAVKDRW
eukprot:753339-Hanusia_phi.AAC.2